MTTKSVRLPAGVDAREYAPKITPLLQVLLATLPDIDFAYESDLEAVRNNAADEILKQKVIENIHLQHQEDAKPTSGKSRFSNTEFTRWPRNSDKGYLAAGHLRQAADPVTLQTAVQRRAGQMQEGGLERIETVIQRQQGVFPEGHKDRPTGSRAPLNAVLAVPSSDPWCSPASSTWRRFSG